MFDQTTWWDDSVSPYYWFPFLWSPFLPWPAKQCFYDGQHSQIIPIVKTLCRQYSWYVLWKRLPWKKLRLFVTHTSPCNVVSFYKCSITLLRLESISTPTSRLGGPRGWSSILVRTTESIGLLPLQQYHFHVISSFSHLFFLLWSTSETF